MSVDFEAIELAGFKVVVNRGYRVNLDANSRESKVVT